MSADEWHAIQRARERYGLDLSEDDLRQMMAKIRTGLSVLMKRKPGGVEVHMVQTRDVVVRAVYNLESCRVITILPPSKDKVARRRLRSGKK